TRGAQVMWRRMTASIVAIDKGASSISFEGPNGWKYSRRVVDPTVFDQVKVGDRIDRGSHNASNVHGIGTTSHGWSAWSQRGQRTLLIASTVILSQRRMSATSPPPSPATEPSRARASAIA